MTRVFSIKVDAAVAAVSGAFAVLLIYSGHAAAVDAAKRYGHNVDSGAFSLLIGLFYLAPVGLLFGLAALAQWRGWRVGRAFHLVAILGAAAPFVGLFAVLVKHAL